jgi:hypothetical protein
MPQARSARNQPLSHRSRPRLSLQAFEPMEAAHESRYEDLRRPPERRLSIAEDVAVIDLSAAERSAWRSSLTVGARARAARRFPTWPYARRVSSSPSLARGRCRVASGPFPFSPGCTMITGVLRNERMGKVATRVLAITDSTPSFRGNGRRPISPACSVTLRSSPSRSARRRSICISRASRTRTQEALSRAATVCVAIR